MAVLMLIYSSLCEKGFRCMKNEISLFFLFPHANSIQVKTIIRQLKREISILLEFFFRSLIQ
jgi:hypothetical protein